MNFRVDINGLRAIAVIAVVLFHFEPSFVSGGFAGVDIFFVISGFLMTGIIFRGLENNSFSLFEFYVSRANRIIPALAVLCLVLLIFGWFYLTPMDYKILGEHVISSLGFFSNIIYWRESGYFDASSYEKWLLHTWSLSVEWQFYIIYPAILIFLKKFISIQNIKYFIVLGIIISFAISIYSTIKWPNASYYLLSSRGWEMLLGGAAYLYPASLKEKHMKWINLTGIVLILLSYSFISKDNLWPGYLAFFPVFGTYLIIISNQQSSMFTNNLFFQKLGKWSYSIYLWHWPIVVYGYYFPTKNWFIIGIALSVLLGWLSFRFIESQKFPSFNQWKELFFVKPIWFCVIVGGIATGIYLSQGVIQRFPDKGILVSELSKKIIMPHRGNGYCFYSFNDDKSLKINAYSGQNCFLGNTKNPNKADTLLFGDSLAGHNDPFWNEVFIKLDKTYQSVSTNWCTPSFTKNFTGPKSHLSYKQCLLNRDFLKEAILHKKYKNIIFAASWNAILKKGYIEEFLEVVSKADKLGINIFVMATPTSYMRNPIPLYFRSIFNENKSFDLTRYEKEYKLNNYVNNLLAEKLKTYQNVYFIDRAMIFSESNTFKFKMLDVPYTLDGSHMSLIGSIHAAKHFMDSNYYIQITSKL